MQCMVMFNMRALLVTAQQLKRQSHASRALEQVRRWGRGSALIARVRSKGQRTALYPASQGCKLVHSGMAVSLLGLPVHWWIHEVKRSLHDQHQSAQTPQQIKQGQLCVHAQRHHHQTPASSLHSNHWERVLIVAVGSILLLPVSIEGTTLVVTVALHREEQETIAGMQHGPTCPEEV
jgi:hypothetical protein